MRVRGRLLARLIIIAAITLLTPALAFAGKLKVQDVRPGSTVKIEVIFNDGFGAKDSGEDENMDKEVIFSIPDQDKVKVVKIISVTPDNKEIQYEITIKVGGVTLASLEPFDVPTFVAMEPDIALFTSIELPDFLVQGNLFTTGQVFSVTQGITPLASAIFFTDGGGNPFTGTVRVHSFDSFEPVPEPTSLLLLGTGLAGIAIKSRKRLKNRKMGHGSQ